jgi:competence protein ComEC
VGFSNEHRAARLAAFLLHYERGMVVVALLPAGALVVGAALGFAAPLPVACWWALLILGWCGGLLGLLMSALRLTLATVGSWLTLTACTLGFAGAGAVLARRAMVDALAPAIVGQSESFRVDVTGARASPLAIEGNLVGDAVATEFGAAFTVDVRRIRIPRGARDPPGAGAGDFDGWRPSAGRVRVTVGGAGAREGLEAWRGERRIRAPVMLSAPLPYRNFGVVDQEQRLALAGIRLFGSIKSAALVDVVGSGRWWQEAGAAARASVRRAVAAWVGRWDPRSAGIVTAILIGDRAGLDADTELRLQRAGTYHVIAISGGNIAILVTLVTVLLRLAGASPRVRAWLAILIVVAYAAMVGSGASVARATLGAVVYLFAHAIDHRSAAINVLAVAVAAILVWAPLEIVDPAFWLTCVATAAILACAGRLHAWLVHWCPARVAGAGPALTWPRRTRAVLIDAAIALLAATMVAEAWLVPMTAYAFSQVTFAGLVLNFAAIPLMAVAQVGGFVVLGAAALWLTPIAFAAGYVSHLAAYALVESARAVDLFPHAALRLPPPPLWLVIVTECAAVACCLAPARTRRRRAVSAASWACALAAVVIAPPGLSPPAAPAVLTPPASLHAAGARAPCVVPELRSASSAWLRLTSLDVAQGDATLLRLPDGETLLIDAGGSATGTYDIGTRIVSPALWALGLRHLRTLALTHGDRDHIGGAGAVLRDFAPREVWEGVPVAGNALLSALRQQASAQGARWRTVSAGDRLGDHSYGDAFHRQPEPQSQPLPQTQRQSPSPSQPPASTPAPPQVQLRVWSPPAPDWERHRVRNDDSIVLEIIYDRVSIILPGDIGPDVERRLAGDISPGISPAPLRVLKAAHHGSGRSSTDAFLRALAPRIAIISAGRGNRFGHPAPAALQRFDAIGSAVFRTDQDGAIELDTDGRDVYVTTCSGRLMHIAVP